MNKKTDINIRSKHMGVKKIDLYYGLVQLRKKAVAIAGGKRLV